MVTDKSNLKLKKKKNDQILSKYTTKKQNYNYTITSVLYKSRFLAGKDKNKKYFTGK